jgi:hypothetical protein
MNNESIPEELVRTMLNDNWQNISECPLPKIIVVNSVDNDNEDTFSRIDLQHSDALVIKSEGGEQIKYRGNVQYYDKTYSLNLEYRTIDSRQRVRNAWRMMRRIIFSNIWQLFPDYQLIRLVNYQESVNTDLKLWRAVVKINLESAGVRIETLSGG